MACSARRISRALRMDLRIFARCEILVMSIPSSVSKRYPHPVHLPACTSSVFKCASVGAPCGYISKRIWESSTADLIHFETERLSICLPGLYLGMHPMSRLLRPRVHPTATDPRHFYRIILMLEPGILRIGPRGPQ